MNLERLKDPFAISDIEWRVQQANAKGAKPWVKVLAYVDARAVQDRLDDVCGPGNWKDEYSHLANGVICKLSIKIDGEWVTKQNGSPETNIESFKGGISKALVRAASTWGIGRYLYRLESQFAIVVSKETKDAHYAKVDGKDVYWLPPKLPSWALPQSQPAKGETKTDPQGKPVVFADYIFQSEPFAGKRLGDMAVKDLRDQLVFWTERHENKAQISDLKKKDLQYITGYLNRVARGHAP